MPVIMCRYTLNVQAQGLTNISRFHYAVGTGGLYTVVLRDKNASSFGVKSVSTKNGSYFVVLQRKNTV